MIESEFERLYQTHLSVLRYFLRSKISNVHDAEEILQEIGLAAFLGFSSLSEHGKFKQWILGIASHKIKDYYRSKAKHYAIPLELVENTVTTRFERFGHSLEIRDIMERLPDKEKQILYLYYFRGLSQKDIAIQLQIPLGTVKSRLSKSKQHFTQEYEINQRKEVQTMKIKNIPTFAPVYQIVPSEKEIFSVVCEEVPGWLVTCRVGEKARFAFYDDPDRHCSGVYTMECVKHANIHGIDCVQIAVTEQEENGQTRKHDLFVKLTDTHCMYIADMRMENNVLSFGSFMDGDWLKNYGIGENNCGRETRQSAKGNAVLHPDGSITVNEKIIETGESDLIGRFTVTIGNKSYDTVAMLSLDCNSILVLQYVTQDGRTVLFRRFNRYDWQQERYGAPWTEKLPDSETVMLNGHVYVHWYDCMPEKVLP